MIKNLLILTISVLVLFSCGICRKYTSNDNSKKVETTTEKSESVKEENKNPTEEKKTVTNTEVEMLTFDKSSLPSDIKYSGNIITGKRWTDKNGENILILTKTNIKKKKSKQPDFDDYIQECELYGYHYVSSGGSFSLLWKISDFINDCPLDLTLDFIPNSLTITDINENGIAESTFLYKMACRGDVSPSELKLMMHENDNKYAIRGNMDIKADMINEKGSYKVDKSFNNAPEGFLNYAKEQWKEFKLETFN